MTITAVVTDIEGTTSSLSFVHDTLFPFARQHLPEYIRKNLNRDEVRNQLAEAAEIAGCDTDADSVIPVLLRWIDDDRKIGPLKSLQGMVWAEGYANGELRGHIYPDAAENLRTWHDRGIRLYIYSSGSVQAQKLIFGHTDFGDLTALFSGFFDTRVGGKKETKSYQAIVNEIRAPAGNTLFLSDVVEELDAARQAGMRTCWLVRDAQADPRASHPQVSDFSQINTE